MRNRAGPKRTRGDARVMRPRKWPCAVGLFVFGMASTASTESMKDFWTQRLPIETLTSNKSALALEYCLGLDASERGTTEVLHGEGVTLVSIMNPGQIISTVMGFRISENGSRRTVAVFARGSALGTWEKWARATAERCA